MRNRPAVIVTYETCTYADHRRRARIRATLGAAFVIALLCVPSPIREAVHAVEHGHAAATPDAATAHVAPTARRDRFARLDTPRRAARAAVPATAAAAHV